MLGGVLTAISWRLVFLINVPLALAVIGLTVANTPELPGDPEQRRHIDWAGTGVFAVAIVALIYGLSRGQPDGWTGSSTVVRLVVCVIAFATLGWLERRAADPLINFRLFRHLNFLASTISQVLAGALELGLGYLLPFYLLLVVGAGPVLAGIALIPGTIPIILAGPMAGRVFDQRGGRLPLVAGFGVLALSGLALGLGASGDSAVALIPGLLLQGLGLGVVLTVNDPVGMNAVADPDRGQAAGIINTAEQLGGAVGIAGLGALQLGYYYSICSTPAWRAGAFTPPPPSPRRSTTSSPRPRRRVWTTSRRIGSSTASLATSSQVTHSHSRWRSTRPRGLPLSARLPARCWSPSSRARSTIPSSAADHGGSPPTPPRPER